MIFVRDNGRWGPKGDLKKNKSWYVYSSKILVLLSPAEPIPRSLAQPSRAHPKQTPQQNLTKMKAHSHFNQNSQTKFKN